MRLPKAISKHTKAFFEKMNPNLVFLCSLACFPSFLFLKSLNIIYLEILVCAFLTLLRRGKTRILPSIIIIAGITFFALLTPYGKIIYNARGEEVRLFGKIPFTLGALENGLHKGGILAGMVFLSQFSISMNMKLPGKIGNFTNTMFNTFSRLSSGKSNQKLSFKPGHIIETIDERLLEIWNEQEKVAEDEKTQSESADARKFHIFDIFAFLLPVASYAALIYDYAIFK